MTLFAELKRRNVFRVGAAYVVAAWLVVQVVETIFPAFGFGDAAVRVVVIVFAIGFIPALVLAWAFEITPDGLKREFEVDRSRSTALATGKKLDRAIVVVLSLTLAYFAVDKFIVDPARDAELQEAAARKGRSEALSESYGDRSIAVLPFENMSADPENQYFSDGISEELLNLLAKIQRLRVISRSSSFAYRGKDIHIPTVAKELDVAYVLEGSVRKSGNRLRITAQLIEANSDTHLWSETYDRELDDVFAIQDEISAAIVGELRNTLDLDVGAATVTTFATSAEAHDAYLRGRYLVLQRTAESVKAAIREFEKAVSLDPDFALGYAELSLATRRLSFRGEISPGEAIAMAKPHAERAMALDPTLAQAHAAMGYVWVTPETTEAAISHFRRATELNPNYSDAHMWLGSFSGMRGNYAEAFSSAQTAARLDPLSRPAVANYAYALLDRNRLADVDRLLEKLSSFAPDYEGYVELRLERAFAGGAWSDGSITVLDKMRTHPDIVTSESLAEGLVLMGLAEEAINIASQRLPIVLAILGRTDEAVEAAGWVNDAPPEGLVARLLSGLALAAAGRYEDARPLLEEAWQLSGGIVSNFYFNVDSALALAAARRDADDTDGAAEVEAAIADNVRRYDEAGMYGVTEWNADFERGVVAFLVGDREMALDLIGNSVDQGYFITPGRDYMQWLYEDEGFAPIASRQKAHEERERNEFLATICPDNPYAEIWQPMEDTCGGIAP